MKIYHLSMRIAAAVIILLIGYVVKKCASGMKKDPPKVTRPAVTKAVSVAEVTYSEVQTGLEYYGRVASSSPVDLSAEVQGKLIRGSVPLKIGQKFSAGQLLFKIDDTETRLSLQSQKSQFQKVIADLLADIKVDFPEQFKIWETYFASILTEKPLPALPEFSGTREKTFFTSKGVVRDYYNILSLEERLKKYAFYAPFSGSFSEVNFEAGSSVNPGTKIARIIRTDQLELVAPVGTEDLQWIKIGSEAEIFTEENEPFGKGKIVRISDRVDPATQALNVYIKILPTENKKAYDGLYLKAVLHGEAVRQAMEIPRKALIDRQFVYIVSDGKLQMKKVHLLRLSTTTAVINGLDANSKIVIDIPVNAREGLDVKIAGS